LFSFNLSFFRPGRLRSGGYVSLESDSGEGGASYSERPKCNSCIAPPQRISSRPRGGRGPALSARAIPFTMGGFNCGRRRAQCGMRSAAGSVWLPCGLPAGPCSLRAPCTGFRWRAGRSIEHVSVNSPCTGTRALAITQARCPRPELWQSHKECFRNPGSSNHTIVSAARALAIAAQFSTIQWNAAQDGEH